MTKLALVLLIGGWALGGATQALAQAQSIDVTYVFDVADTDATNGDIMLVTDKGIIRAAVPADSRIFGVLQDNPLLVYKTIGSGGRPIARAGIAQVNVSTLNGEVKPGDYITSSEIPGRGMKATQSGYVIGVVLSSFGKNEGTQIDYQSKLGPKKIAVGQVMVAVKIEYAEIATARTFLRMLNNLFAALFVNVQNPDQFIKVFRYITAALVVMISFSIGFLTFSRSISKGTEAIGRNPLAQKAILFSIILNIVFTILTTAAGIIAAAFILRL